MSILFQLKSLPMANYYRMVRDEWKSRHCQFAKTPRGYYFAGRPDMQAGNFEPYEGTLIQRQLVSADVFIDVGANIGYYTCLALSMKKHTVAIEPLPENLRLLYSNLSINGWTKDVEIYPVGLSDKPGLASLYGGGNRCFACLRMGRRITERSKNHPAFDA